MQKNKFKITSQVYKQIEELAKTLHPLHKTDKAGNVLHRQTSKTIKGKDLPKGTKLADGKTIDPNKLYVRKGTEPVLVNHSVSLRDYYQKHGQAGIEAYKQWVTDVMNKESELVAEENAQRVKKQEEANANGGK
jgi:hypothetical protein